MKSRISKSLTISFAIAAALAMPTAVKAQSSNVETTTSVTSVSADQLDAEYSNATDDPWVCLASGGIWVPLYGCLLPY